MQRKGKRVTDTRSDAITERKRIVAFLREQAAMVLMGGIEGQLDLDRAEFSAGLLEEVAESLNDKEHWIGYN